MVVEVPNRRSKRSLRTREAILDAAGKVLAEHGYEATSLDLIAAEAGVTKATIYYHFDAKESIYAAVVLRYLQRAFDSLNAAVDRYASSGEALEAVIDDQIEDTLSPSMRYVHYQEKLRLGDSTHKAVRAAQRQYEYRLAEIIADAQQAGQVMAGDPHILAMVVIGTIGRTARWYRSTGRTAESEFRRMLREFVLHGLRPAGVPPR